MHVHNVYFWLKNNEKDSSFEAGLHQLSQDPRIKNSYIGSPSTTRADHIDSSYTYGLVFIFADLAAHDAYQAGSLHTQFLDDHRHKWEKVIVFNIAT